jgi:hypothetical protein
MIPPHWSYFKQSNSNPLNLGLTIKWPSLAIPRIKLVLLKYLIVYDLGSLLQSANDSQVKLAFITSDYRQGDKNW